MMTPKQRSLFVRAIRRDLYTAGRVVWALGDDGSGPARVFREVAGLEISADADGTEAARAGVAALRLRAADHGALTPLGDAWWLAAQLIEGTLDLYALVHTSGQWPPLWPEPEEAKR